jgi:hypothetical protein
MLENGEVYTLMEINCFIKIDKKGPIFGSQVKSVHDILFERVPCLILASYRTTARAVKRYKIKGKLPIPGDEGVKMGHSPLVQLEEIPQLNEGIHEHIEKVESKKDLAKGIIAIAKQRNEQQGVDAPVLVPSQRTLKKYNLKASSQPGVSLTKLSGTCPQGIHQQMVAMSLWNMVSHIIALGMMHFIPGKFEHPKLLSPGASINKNVVSLCQFVH